MIDTSTNTVIATVTVGSLPGYSAYFDDLTPEIKQEIIDRTYYSSVGPPSGGRA